MSLGVVFGAFDGLLVVVDGQMSELASQSPTGRRVVDNERRKFAFPPDGAVVVILTGQATLCGIPAWKWAQEQFASVHDGEVAGDLSTPQSVSRVTSSVMSVAVEKDNENRQRKGMSENAGVTGLVAGYPIAGAREETPGEVWALEVDGDGEYWPTLVPGFGDKRSWGRSIIAVPERPSYRDPSVDGHGRLPADAVYDRFGPVADALRTRSLADVRELVEAEMPDLIEREEGVMDRHGVGGIWTIIELRPNTPPRLDVRDWGPIRSISTAPGEEHGPIEEVHPDPV